MKNIYLQPLNRKESEIIEYKGTEAPFTGEYWNHFDEGVYICRKCGKPLYRSESKFSSECGWPSFDDRIPKAVSETPDADGRRIEITCSACGGHLGHVFTGEKYTEKNTRHCVNSLSIHYIRTQRAVFASGCFWGTQYHFDRSDGVILTAAGYAGGETEFPTYTQVCTGTTGHVEAVEVLYDPERTSFEKLAKLYFETHDPSQTNGQGPDIGNQYLSVLFYNNKHEKKRAEQLISILESKGITVATKLVPAGIFWPAETYHQHYYDVKGSTPYCHMYIKKF
ncbi:MAG: bifunctional methionine sulfoxide reductase B/A protein [Bacteroidetes bacterium]|nr:bifunctional methionine sulfoxide reductase B/A protein [Bacteroidota bacterium]